MTTYTLESYTLADVYGAGTYDCANYTTSQTLTTTGSTCTASGTPLVNTGTVLIFVATLAVVLMMVTTLVTIWRRPKRTNMKDAHGPSAHS